MLVKSSVFLKLRGAKMPITHEEARAALFHFSGMDADAWMVLREYIEQQRKKESKHIPALLKEIPNVPHDAA